MISVKLVESTGSGQDQLFTLYLQYPRVIDKYIAEHRDFSRTVMHPALLPVTAAHAFVRDAPYVPEVLGKDEVSTAAPTEELADDAQTQAQEWWSTARAVALKLHQRAIDLGIHSAQANLVIEPFMLMQAVITASYSQWERFCAWRGREGSAEQLELSKLVFYIWETIKATSHDIRGSTHIPDGLTAEQQEYIMDLADRADMRMTQETAHFDGVGRIGYMTLLSCMYSVGRCIRRSYGRDRDDGTLAEIIKAGFVRLGQGHISDMEHQAFEYKAAYKQGKNQPDWHTSNLPSDWVQFRKIYEHNQKDFNFPMSYLNNKLLPLLVEAARKDKEKEHEENTRTNAGASTSSLGSEPDEHGCAAEHSAEPVVAAGASVDGQRDEEQRKTLTLVRRPVD